MMIPFGRRRLVISLISRPRELPSFGAETDAELAHLDARRRANLERAQWDIYRITHEGPLVR